MTILLHKIEGIFIFINNNYHISYFLIYYIDKDFVYVNDRKARKRSKRWANYLTIFQMTSIAVFSLYLYYSNGGFDHLLTEFHQYVNK